MIKNKSNSIVTLRIDESYRNYFKAEAAKKGKSIVEYSRELAQQQNRKQENGFKLNF